MKTTRILPIGIFVLALATGVFAQSDRGTITGTVIDRSFRIRNRARFEVRGEFFNAFNRIQLNNPDVANPLQTQARNAQGVPTSGFGRINTGTVFGPPRSGQIVTRLSW